MDNIESFGARASSLTDPVSLIEFESKEGKGEFFAEVDALLADVAVRALRREAIVQVQRGRDADFVSIIGLDVALQTALGDGFTLANQNSRGAWFLPEKTSLKAGLVNLPNTFARFPRFATGLAWEARARVLLADSPAAVFLWAALEPLFEQLFIPFDLRGRTAGMKSREGQVAAWASLDELASALGFDIGDELAVMHYGGGWSRLPAAEQLEAKQRLLAALEAQAGERLAARYRAYRLLPLIGRYYNKAKNGQALRKQVLNRPLEKTLVAFFGGDWLRLLQYLGEASHPGEEIVVAIPETKLFVGGAKGPVEAGTQCDVPSEEHDRALSAVVERVTVLKAFWGHFDEIHSRQAPRTPDLWGLVEEDQRVRISWDGSDSYNFQLYRKLLPVEVVAQVDRLWGSVMLPRWPDRIVSEISPHALMAVTFGPALRFWQGCALTAWFVCEGPSSRTDLAGFATYYQGVLSDLEGVGCPIDPALFAELRDAETRLGAPEPITEKISSQEDVVLGLKIEIRITRGERRAGFKLLRDIITRYRRSWADEYLDSYLRERWESELREAARRHAHVIAEKGKPPTPKQFARHAEAATNHWFGGDLSFFYAAIGEECPVDPARVTLQPADQLDFVKRVFESLGGRHVERRTPVGNREERLAQDAEEITHSKLRWLAEESLAYIQLEEALGREPDLNEFGASRFEYRGAVLSPDMHQAWTMYSAAIEKARKVAFGAARGGP